MSQEERSVAEKSSIVDNGTPGRHTYAMAAVLLLLILIVIVGLVAGGTVALVAYFNRRNQDGS